MNLSGRELMRLLEHDGWTSGGRRTHGMFYYKQFPGEERPTSTVVPDKSTPLTSSTLGAILSVKQTGLGQSAKTDRRSVGFRKKKASRSRTARLSPLTRPLSIYQCCTSPSSIMAAMAPSNASMVKSMSASVWVPDKTPLVRDMRSTPRTCRA